MNRKNISKNKETLALLGGRPVLQNTLPEYNTLGIEEKRALMRVMDRKIISDFVAEAGGKFLGGKEVQNFEKNMSQYFKVSHAVSFNSATTALQAAVAALGIGPGDEVITSPYTMSATSTSILLNNAIPVFADIDPNTYSLDPVSIEKRITRRTKAILVVNIFGGSSDFGGILRLAKKYNLRIIEDNAQAIGARYKDKFLGTMGDIGVFSFNVHKIVQSGEGGVLVTNNKHLAFRAQLARNHGEVVVGELMQKGGSFEAIVGSNYRLSELHAAVANEQLKKLKKLLAGRVQLAEYLTLKLQKFSWLRTQTLVAGSTHAYYVYPCRFLKGSIGISRRTFARALAAEGFGIAEGYVKPLYLLPVYQKRKMFPHSRFPFVSKEFRSNTSYRKGICPITERLYEKEFFFTTLCQQPSTKKTIDGFVRALKKIEDNIEVIKKYERKR